MARGRHSGPVTIGEGATVAETSVVMTDAPLGYRWYYDKSLDDDAAAAARAEPSVPARMVIRISSRLDAKAHAIRISLSACGRQAIIIPEPADEPSDPVPEARVGTIPGQPIEQ